MAKEHITERKQASDGILNLCAANWKSAYKMANTFTVCEEMTLIDRDGFKVFPVSTYAGQDIRRRVNSEDGKVELDSH